MVSMYYPEMVQRPNDFYNQHQNQDLQEEFTKEHYMQKAPVNQYTCQKLSIVSPHKYANDHSVETSPFNRNSIEMQTNSSAITSTKNARDRQVHDEGWNEEELYDLSCEDSENANVHQIDELSQESIIEEEFKSEVNMDKYIVDNNPTQHTRGSNSLCSQNTTDLNKLLFAHKREVSNGNTNSNL